MTIAREFIRRGRETVSNFHVGQMVVCVDDRFGGKWRAVITKNAPALPTKGIIYTIREIEIGWSVARDAYLRLEELTNPAMKWDDGDVSEVAFGAQRFRPVKHTSIEQFRKLVAPIKDKALTR